MTEQTLQEKYPHCNLTQVAKLSKLPYGTVYNIFTGKQRWTTSYQRNKLKAVASKIGIPKVEFD